MVVQLSALIDSGAVMSCTPTSPVAHLLAHTSINRASAAALCTADGSPLAGVKGELVVPVRMGDRVFQVPMQVIDSDIPFILGMDFFEATHASINYGSKELVFPPSPTQSACAVPIQIGGGQPRNDGSSVAVGRYHSARAATTGQRAVAGHCYRR